MIIANNEIVCPWCGFEYSDSWDYVDYNSKGRVVSDLECEKCDKPFRTQPELVSLYYTDKIEDK